MKTSKMIFIAIVILTLILLGALSLGLYTSNDIKIRTEQMSQINNEDVRYHVMMIINKSDETYSDAFFDGVKLSAKAYNVAVETIEVEERDYLNEVVDRLDMAIYSKVDGIILHAYNDPDIIDRINQASEMGIPVITLNENLHQSKRISYAGNNRYSIGINVGKTIAELTSGRGKIAVVDQIDYENNVVESTDLLNLGIKDVVDDYEKLEIVLTRHTDQGVLSAETIATEILEDYPEIDAIFCTDSQSTLGIVQVLIDRNRVNDFTIIGYGNDMEILDYISRGTVIQATIITDDFSVGKASIEAFYNYKENGIVNTEYLPSIIVVNQENVSAYLKELGLEDEE